MRYSAWLATASAALLLLSGACFASEPSFEQPEGTTLATGSAPGEMSLANGVTLRASPRSTGTVFSDHLVLDEGSVRVANFAGYTVDAHQLHIQADDPAAQAVVRFSQNNTVEVASLGGNLNVTAGGALLTRVTSGTRVSFQPKSVYPNSGGTASDEHVMLWIIVIAGAAALAIGLTAAVQGKSPF